MMSRLFLSLTAFSCAFSLFASAEQFSVSNEQEELFEEAEDGILEKKQEERSDQRKVAFPQKKEGQRPTEASILAEPQKMKPHYAGVRKPEPRVRKRKSTKIKNQWFSSKTHPKTERKTAVVDEPPEVIAMHTELPADRPFYIRKAQLTAQNSSSTKNQRSVYSEDDRDIEEEQEGRIYPETGFQAPAGHVYLTAEYLLWRTRQDGMEFATAKKINFGFSSGFRAGLGVHMPYDGWDIYVNYTRFTPDESRHSHGSFYPLFLFEGAGSQGPAITEADAHWDIEFQNVDVEIGRVYFIARTLSLRPFLGLKGAWIDQHARIHYAGGFIPAGQTFRTHFENDFKGAGPMIGMKSNWHIGAGFSLFGDFATALVVGHFDNEQKQYQLDGAEVVHLDTDFNLVSPFLQLIAGLAWDRNFNRDRCHFGLSAGFETQYWWNQNQIEQLTDSDFPIYVREKGDLAFYGLTLRGRLDF